MSFAVAPLLASSGLRYLLDPIASAPAARLACGIAGTVYPAYASFKALEASSLGDDKQWLTYWSVFASLSLVEEVVEDVLRWLPYYYHGKLALLIWLQLPQTKGAKVLHEKFVRPLLLRYHKKIDKIIDYWAGPLDMLLSRPELQYIGQLALAALCRTKEFIAWFFSDDGSSKRQGQFQSSSGPREGDKNKNDHAE